MCDPHLRLQGVLPSTSMSDFVDELVVGLTNGRIYEHDHARVKASLDELTRCQEELCQAMGKEAIVLGASDGFLFHDGRPLLGASLAAPRLIGPLEELGSGGVAFTRGCDEDDFVALIRLLGRKIGRPANLAEANRELESKGCTKILLLPPFGSHVGSAGGISAGELDEQERKRLLSIPAELYQGTVDMLQNIVVKAARGEALDLGGARTFVESILKQLGANAQEMMRVGRYERYDAFTFGHSIRVGFLALNFARAFIRDEELLHRVGVAALMHDIGKSRVPFEILHWTGRLDDEQRAEMNKHVEHGGRILVEMTDNDPMAVAAAFGHHQSPGGGGYPQTLHEVRLSTCTRIVKICDVYEALTAVRPYKDRMSPIRAYRIMLSMEGHFDLGLLRRFIQVNGIYPVGSHVSLNTGDRAQVVDQSHNMALPVIELETDEMGTTDPESRTDLSTQIGEKRIEVAEFIQ